jgi:hypothetical protein
MAVVVAIARIAQQELVFQVGQKGTGRPIQVQGQELGAHNAGQRGKPDTLFRATSATDAAAHITHCASCCAAGAAAFVAIGPFHHLHHNHGFCILLLITVLSALAGIGYVLSVPSRCLFRLDFFLQMPINQKSFDFCVLWFSFFFYWCIL